MDVPGELHWEPEPLELPLCDDEPPRRRIREQRDDGDESGKLPGSCVIVIDLT